MTKKTTNNPTPQNSSETGGHFATGFFLGAIGGALGTLLFSTEKGQKILAQLREEFEPHMNEVLESPEVQALVEEYEVVKDGVSKKVAKAQKKFPKFSAHQPKS